MFVVTPTCPSPSPLRSSAIAYCSGVRTPTLQRDDVIHGIAGAGAIGLAGRRTGMLLLEGIQLPGVPRNLAV